MDEWRRGMPSGDLPKLQRLAHVLRDHWLQGVRCSEPCCPWIDPDPDGGAFWVSERHWLHVAELVAEVLDVPVETVTGQQGLDAGELRRAGERIQADIDEHGVEQPGLFALDPALVVDSTPEDELSWLARLRRRQWRAIQVGCHPLAVVASGVRLHPDADRSASPRDPSAHELPLRCGSCTWRKPVPSGRGRAAGNTPLRTYPKCTHPRGRTVDLAAAADALADVALADRPASYSHGPATDIRVWWPACDQYERTTR